MWPNGTEIETPHSAVSSVQANNTMESDRMCFLKNQKHAGLAYFSYVVSKIRY